ncbi:uncharacterized protein KY384_003705 [Bacidia gigantensis]|uniref:uncharacterized protein n=1 Tax=Bacidia gigantensis TaxID=2732470 RepID=UPI001D04B7D0|nr:uncharacterized protein KY384_003705 [Bacidia gigantensis]KAG8532068.1 hypothetical protein KY384_003705 [Bacidia gigantensis]
MTERLVILLIGNGGREDALAWRLSQSARVSQIYVAPGNGGTARGRDKVSNISISSDDFPALVQFSKDQAINLVVPGSEAPLVAGVTDYFKNAIPNIRIFGPSKAAAVLEGSKTFSKNFMKRYKIPTARYSNFSDYEKASNHIADIDYDIVIKATGLAAGKGVIIPAFKEEAQAALKGMMLDERFGDAGKEVVIEDTGGMGAYSPAPIATPDLVEEIHRTALQPTIDAMRKNEHQPFIGLLFTGFMITKDGPRVLEYNVRFGDPETQTLLPLLDPNTDLAEIMVACTDRWLDGVDIKIKDGSSVTVVAAAEGYPGSYQKGEKITINRKLKLRNTDHIFHAGTSMNDSTLETAGGRVVAATSTADSLEQALKQAYSILDSITWPGKYFRKDIGHRALATNSPSESQEGSAMTYAGAGVSISTGNELVKRIKPLVQSTARPGTSAVIGGFGGTFDLCEAGYEKPPRTVTCTDGVGTKLMIAQAIGKHDTIGIDLVAMNANDVVVQGAEPLKFTDVYTCGRLDVDIAVDVIKGVCEGCKQANCALVGGETAEMAGLLQPGAYDINGTCEGAIPWERKELPNKAAMKEGDILLGLASSGCHSNGFSLYRKIIEKVGLRYTDEAPWNLQEAVGESLLTPTRIYVKSLLKAVDKDLIKGMAHITGGGLIENVPRMLPSELAAQLDARTWECPAILRWLKKAGNVSDEEFCRVFNTGLGMVLVVDRDVAEEVRLLLRHYGEKVSNVGLLSKREGPGCEVENQHVWNT